MQSETIYLDGTFSYSSKLFKQLVTLHWLYIYIVTIYH